MKRTLTTLLCLVMLFTAMPMVFAASDYWGFDDYEVFENPETDELTSYPTTVKRTEDAKYSFVSELDSGTMTITFKEMAWGTYNLWEWSLKDKSGTNHVFLTGGTDLEYVYRTSKNAGGPMYFTGGNHGNEALVSLEFYNGETGEKIELAKGESINVNVLHIIEKTNLLYFPDVNPADSIGDYINKNQTYTESDIFANVTRKYTITGPQVRLNVDYKYVMDVYHGVSYTCMFPIAKKYGLYADMIDKDGNLVKTVVTADVGKADYSGPMNSGNKATRAILYGKNFSQYQFDVHINTYEDSLESQKNSFLTAFWDMNTTQNKLYFSKCDNSTLVKYPKGKEVHTECVWRFLYDADGRTPTEAPDKPDNEGPQDNLARGRDYIISVTNDDPGAPEYNTYYAADLTDGIAATEFNASNNSWFAFSAYKPNIVNGVGTVTVDLGGQYKITKLRAHLFNNVAGMGVKPPKSVSAYGIVDGKEVKLCDFESIPSDDAIAYWISAESDSIVTDKVIFKFTLDGAFMYLNEIEIHGEDPNSPDNIALGKEYTVSGCGAPYGQFSANLTDGKATTSITYDDNWFAFYNNGSDNSVISAPNGIGSIVIDLGGYYSIDSVRVNTLDLKGDSGIKAPAGMKVYLSDDGESWSEATALTSPVPEKNVAYYYEGKVKGNARYVKVEVTLNGVLAFINEIEVFGSEAPEYTLGDVNSDGAINQYDYLLVKRHYFGTRYLTDNEMLPADVNSDGAVNQYDYILIKRHYFGTYVIG
ncbi:MAG: hypothetical protein E7595_05715 [Ruminococcaceae bacterium]|nr:hypothetical protein [Oscillospiraceae bacterium]